MNLFIVVDNKGRSIVIHKVSRTQAGIAPAKVTRITELIRLVEYN